MKLNTKALLSFLLLLFVSACDSQTTSIDRKPSAAGLYYPARVDELNSTLDDLFARALPSMHLQNLRAIIVPHAGYVFSGRVAASGFNQIDPEKSYDNIFILGPSHYVDLKAASIYTAGDFETPLGKVKVNRQLGDSLVKASPLFTNLTEPHAREHSIEVELPFLQRLMKKDFRIVPIVIGGTSTIECESIAGALQPFFNDRNLFIVSTDFSHYPAYDDAVRLDKETADAIMSDRTGKLLSILRRNEQGNVPNLVTSLCGWPAVLTLMYMTQGMGVTYTPVLYENSAASPAGVRESVVGYWSIAVTANAPKQETGFLLNESDRSALLALARKTVTEYLNDGRVPEPDPGTLTTAMQTPCGAFVTLTERKNLRGCIGLFASEDPLYRVVQQMAVAAATKDPRFSPVSPSEVGNLEIEISVLTPMRRIRSADEFQLGKQGIYIRKGDRSGTFLPQVAEETGWSKEEFLGHCAQDKAGIGWDGWKDAELYVYEALVFAEK